ncbi:MAG: phosphatase PAP2 family protein [Mangrovibacterium sp.]
MLEKIIELDKSIFYFLNGLHSPTFDVAMSLFTRAELWGAFFIAIIICIGRTFGRKSLGVFLALGLIVLIADQGSGLVKEWAGRLRPTHDPSMQGLVHYVIKRGGKLSYFSAHAANTFGVAMFLSLLFKNRTFSIIVFSWAAIASYTRIYLGLHFPADILTGITFGLLIGWGMFRLVGYLDRRFFGLTSSRVSKTMLSVQQSQTILLVFIMTILMVILVANRLLHTGLIANY